MLGKSPPTPLTTNGKASIATPNPIKIVKRDAKSLRLVKIGSGGYPRKDNGCYACGMPLNLILDILAGEAVNLSQLNLIYLAGSERSKAGTTGIHVTPQNQERRKRSGVEDVMYNITTV
ncbi:hypothetical protein Lser_V15G39837 [Lactuca serriola]